MLFRQPYFIILITIITVSFTHLFAQTEDEIKFYRDNGIQPLIKGTQSGNFPTGTYLIPHDIMIESGKTMTIFPGSIILFSQDAMLVVNGKLVCSGTFKAPIVFKRLDNQLYFNPIDPRIDTRWDGIYLPDSGQLDLNNTVISESKYGIVVSGKKVSMAFDSVRFINNKFQNVKIGDKMMKIDPRLPLNFRYPEEKGVYLPPATIRNATETIQQKDLTPHRTAYPKLRIAMSAAAGVGLLAGAAGLYYYKKYNDDYQKTHDENDLSLSTSGMIAAAVGATVFGVGTAGVVWTFFY